ncbi:MAG TPA: hypothetical protein VIK56_12750 [Rhodoferax sp.]
MKTLMRARKAGPRSFLNRGVDPWPSQAVAESTDNKLAVQVLKEIADEELARAGELLRLQHELASNDEKFYANGAKEVEKKIKKMK